MSDTKKQFSASAYGRKAVHEYREAPAHRGSESQKLRVLSIEPGSLADRVGLKAGDEIHELNGRPLLDAIDFQFNAANVGQFDGTHRGSEHLNGVGSRSEGGMRVSRQRLGRRSDVEPGGRQEDGGVRPDYRREPRPPPGRPGERRVVDGRCGQNGRHRSVGTKRCPGGGAPKSP